MVVEDLVPHGQAAGQGAACARYRDVPGWTFERSGTRSEESGTEPTWMYSRRVWNDHAGLPAELGAINTVRGIKSFVLRQGRLTDAQARALEEFWTIYGIDYHAARIDLDAIFHRTAPKILDIGSGMGETLIRLAQRHPDNDYIAVEVHRPGVGSLIRNAATLGLQNVRVINHDVIEVLRDQLPERCLDEIYIFFADPWPKKRHHKRRLVNPAFLTLLKPKLKPHARIFMATDWADLAEHLLGTCDQDPDLINIAGAGNYTPRPQWRPVTKFENRGIKLDHGVWDLCYCLA